jgi:hypothetical protein
MSSSTEQKTPTTTSSARPPAAGRVDLLIHKDHEYIKQLHQHIKRESDPATKQRYCHELIRMISLHSVAEEIIVYPVVEKRYVYVLSVLSVNTLCIN